MLMFINKKELNNNKMETGFVHDNVLTVCSYEWMFEHSSNIKVRKLVPTRQRDFSAFAYFSKISVSISFFTKKPHGIPDAYRFAYVCLSCSHCKKNIIRWAKLDRDLLPPLNSPVYVVQLIRVKSTFRHENILAFFM